MSTTTDGPLGKRTTYPCRCGTEAEILHHDPEDLNNPKRVLCGACAAKASRKVLDSQRRQKPDADLPFETPAEQSRKGKL